MSPSGPVFTANQLIPGTIYRVKMSFMDYDGFLHPAGETWQYIRNSFLPYEDGLTLFIEQDGQLRGLRLQWREDAQAQTIEHFSDFVEVL